MVRVSSDSQSRVRKYISHLSQGRGVGDGGMRNVDYCCIYLFHYL